jgi:uncharacterized protein (TIGR00255 family)
MIKSMTAFGRAEKNTPFGKWILEIHSVNRKMLDVQIVMSKDFLRFDLDLRKWISEQLFRGYVTVRITHRVDEDVIPNTLESLKKLKGTWQKIAQEMGYDPDTIDLPFLLERMPEASVMDFEDKDEEIRKVLNALTQAALDEMLKMKRREGKHLAEDMLKRVDEIEKAAQKIKGSASKIAENFRQKLISRLENVVPFTPENEERYFRELAFYAEKSDITEELTRLESHFQQFRHYLGSEEKSIGKTLDFLMHEMQREVNTLAAKTQESEVAHVAVMMKAECEKIREQLQNVE